MAAHKMGKFTAGLFFVMGLLGAGGKAFGQQTVKESYTVQEVRINYKGGAETVTVIATSDADGQGQYQTGSKQKTILNMTLKDAVQAHKPVGYQYTDDRLQDVKIDYTNPTANNMANFSARLYAYNGDQSKVKYMAMVNGSGDLETSTYFVSEIDLHGFAPVIINGSPTGSAVEADKRSIETDSKGLGGEGLAVAIDFSQNQFTRPIRKVIPQGQLRPVAEIVQTGTIEDQSLQKQQQQNPPQQGGFFSRPRRN